MPLSMFKEKQTIVAMLVAKHDEPAWGVPTLCCRLLAQDGSQLELQSTGEARQHFDQFPLHVVCSFEVARACVKAYGATSKTGIKSKAFLRMAYKPKAFQRVHRSLWRWWLTGSMPSRRTSTRWPRQRV